MSSSSVLLQQQQQFHHASSLPQHQIKQSVSSSWESEVLKILVRIFSRKDSELFREPVAWQELGLLDYLMVVKTPMDLTTVRRKLESGKEYRKPEDCAADIRLIWHNAMLYNAAGSRVYFLAKTLSELFETAWSQSVIKDDVDRPPQVEEMQAWAESCHRISPEDLGKILSYLESACPQCLVKRSDTSEVDVNVDLIGARCFRELKTMIDEKKRKLV